MEVFACLVGGDGRIGRGPREFAESDFFCVGVVWGVECV